MYAAVIIEPRRLTKTVGVIRQFHKILCLSASILHPLHWKFYLFCGKNTTQWWQRQFDFSVECIELETNNLSSDQYNDLLKTESFWNHFIDSEYVLLFQSDAWLNDYPRYTIDTYIQEGYSYLGGYMAYTWKELEILKSKSLNIPYHEYGNYNGGLSLRRTRDMLYIIQNIPTEPTMAYIAFDVTPENRNEIIGRMPEDAYFTVGCYLLGLKIGDANDEIASTFACHSYYKKGYFGFHLSRPCRCLYRQCKTECPSLDIHVQIENNICYQTDTAQYKGNTMGQMSCVLYFPDHPIDPPNIPRIAIYQGYPHFHYECIGYIVEFCQSRNWHFDIFCQIHDKQSDSWMNFYNDLFSINVSYWKDPSTFYPDNYDKIFLVTDDDPSYQVGWHARRPENVICINHYCKTRRLDLTHYVGTRYFPNGDIPTHSQQWAYQMYHGIWATEKINRLLEQNRKYIVCIGESHPRDSMLESYFTNMQDYEWVIVTRTIHATCINTHRNIQYHKNLYGPVFFEWIKNASYVFCADSDKNRTDSCSAAISMAFTFGCRLILSDTWQSHFRFQSAITYVTDGSRKTHIPPLSIGQIQSVIQERTEYIEKRNAIFGRIVDMDTTLVK